VIKPRGFKRTGFQSTAQHDNGVALPALVDDPGVGGGAQEGSAEDEAESGEKDY